MRRAVLSALVLTTAIFLPLHAQEGMLPEEPPPKTWADVGPRYSTECPIPMFTLAQSERITVGPHNFEILGSHMNRTNGPWKGPIKIGVLGAIKEAGPETKANLKKAAKEFKKRGVQFVVANGDISEGEFDLEDAFDMLGTEITVPVFVHIGNSEGKGSFSRAYLKTAKTHEHLFNMTWIRHVNFGGIHLVSLPGYYNIKFLHGKAGCHYKAEHVRELGKLIAELPKNEPVILTAHGPPQSFGKDAIDVAVEAGNVGDPEMATLVNDTPIPFGIFGHILEAGGRATADLKRGTPIKLPMKKPSPKLYFNAGSASGLPWAMLNNKQSYGMAAVLTVNDGKGSVEFITLRKGP